VNFPRERVCFPMLAILSERVLAIIPVMLIVAIFVFLLPCD